jgi:adenine-specific DNA methylase
VTDFKTLYPDVGRTSFPLRAGPALDREPLASASRGAKNTLAYNAHSYPTKVPPEGIAPFIEHYTEPGSVVLDAFCGSGMTGLAASQLGRRAVLNDLSVGATHLAWNLVTACEPDALVDAAEQVLSTCAEELRTLYRVGGNNDAHLHWTLHSQRVECPHCGAPSSVWHDGADAERGKVADKWQCPSCNKEIVKRRSRLLGAEPVLVSVTDRGGRRERPVTPDDLEGLKFAEEEDVPYWYPHVPMGPDREMFIRSALHLQGISEVADFWTRRNLRALAYLWAAILAWPDQRVRQALAFAFTNTAWHGSRMRRYNARGGQRPLTGTLYIPQLSIEVNVADVFRHKIRQLQRFYARGQAVRGEVDVILGSACDLPLPNNCVDYCFTDPPFGSNIFYADCALVWESWLGALTDVAAEAVVNRSLRATAGGKTVDQYADLMERSFAEINRVLKPKGWTTVVFQSSDATVWSALREAVEAAGFDFASASYFDKTQQSHKGYKGRAGAEDVASFDVVLSLQKASRRGAKRKASPCPRDAGDLLEQHLRGLPPVGEDRDKDRERTLPFLHSFLVQAHLNGELGPEYGDFGLVRRVCRERFECDPAGHWFVPAETDAEAA